MLLRTTALILATSWVAATSAQEANDGLQDPIRFLRAEATSARALFHPSRPISVRFTLFNPTDETIEIPVARTDDAPEAITLPRDLIVGNGEQPALFITHENEKPVAVRPEARSTAGTLRLAPRASVGAEVDLCSVYRQLRYSGSYRVEWQPLGGRVPPVALMFLVEPRQDAVLTTDYGNITFTLMYDEAPRNVENFLDLVRDDFYNRKTIHRVVPGFIIQGGSPDGSGKGARPDGKFVQGEFHNAPFELGTLAMARKPNDPDSASCQFFISLARLEELDGKYTVIGQARDDESLRALRSIEQLPTNSGGHPLRTLPIRTFKLVPAETGSEVLQLNTPRP